MAEPANFIWYELLTSDPDAAAAFYGEVVGWTIPATADPQAGSMDYRMIGRNDGGNAGGVMKITAEMARHGASPTWLGYLHAPDVDAAVAAIVAEGGKALMPPFDLPVGRIAMIADPQGAALYLMRPTPPPDQPDATSDVFSVDRPQHVRWNELQSSDAEAAVAFYTSHFGWTQQGTMEMGAFGTYRFIQAGGTGIGAIMPLVPGTPQSRWSFYIGVDDIDRAVAAIAPGGGTVTGPVQQIPGGEYSVHAIDPQGATFGLVGPRHGG